MIFSQYFIINKLMSFIRLHIYLTECYELTCRIFKSKRSSKFLFPTIWYDGLQLFQVCEWPLYFIYFIYSVESFFMA